MRVLDFLVKKDELGATRLGESSPQPIGEGQIRLRVEKFALTANNITYAAFGEAMHYWGFYPAEAGWGRIPVWGFASVIESRCPGIEPGERFYGYYPMSNEGVLQPKRLSPTGFMEGAEHRATLHAVYNNYVRCVTDPFHDPKTEDAEAILRPLYTTSWLIDDFMADNDFFGATAAGTGLVMLSSASSKTAYGTAFQLARRMGIELVGLTSAANVAFCESLGCYRRVLAYDQLARLDRDAASIYIDFAGNASLRRTIHGHCANLKFSSSIGGTHVEQLGGARNLPGPRPVLFFAPAQIKKRSTEWGAEVLGQRLLESWREFIRITCRPTDPWLLIEHHRGADAVTAAYARVLSGRDDPRRGRMLSLVEPAA
ncbi:MAG: DUF2855 family protein [Rhodocyclales bacterium]|nr:DUF2855 family protein [Rhodocyclales bacterium]